jgi:Gas vesicle protein
MSLERTTPGASLIELLERILDKGIVVDASARVSQVGIDPMTDDAADRGGLDPDVPEVSHYRRMNDTGASGRQLCGSNDGR